MAVGRPVMIVLARVRPSRLEEFRAWYRTEHVPHVLAIPGIVGYRVVSLGSALARDAPNLVSAFFFADEHSIDGAMRSDEAQLARGDWEKWSSDVRELQVEIYGTLDARGVVRHYS